MDPAANPQGSSQKSKEKKQPRKAKSSGEAVTASEGASHPSARPLKDKIENIKGSLELVRRYVRKKPGIGLSFALAIGIVAGSLSRD
jgi:ElaB/YqjD/DUF883 family membrane-anchored ribosome-binding protein